MKFGDAFASSLHEHYMKPAGFKKKGHTFSRACTGYSEHYNIQGSAWNSAGSAWRCYVNCGISFPDIPVIRPGSGMYQYHAHTRLGYLVQGAPSEYDVTEHNLDEILTQLSSEIERCGIYFDRRHQTLKESYLALRFEIGFPYDPELKRG